jgi:hypothetical protein
VMSIACSPRLATADFEWYPAIVRSDRAGSCALSLEPAPQKVSDHVTVYITCIIKRVTFERETLSPATIPTRRHARWRASTSQRSLIRLVPLR